MWLLVVTRVPQRFTFKLVFGFVLHKNKLYKGNMLTSVVNIIPIIFIIYY